MANLELFKKFANTIEKSQKASNEVWLYTRVSSKDQYVNNSLHNQEKLGKAFAEKHNYYLNRIFGGTYESASGDITRKEFTRLIKEVKSARKKPFAILIYKMSRFSRTGGNGISLANELIEQLNVQLIEVSTGRNTQTERGKIEIYESLLEARKETINKLEFTIPGMITFVENGNRFGNAPFGYEHYGPRVKNISKIREKQEIVANKEGKLLEKAWVWKVNGERDVDIAKKLEELGLNINSKKLSKMWRNPFYCGISTSKLLKGNIVRGNWEKIVSEENFLRVQKIIEGNKKNGYEKYNENRPLNGFIYCSKCGAKYVGYEVKKKGLHYYRCLNCNGMSINANTTSKAVSIGAHNLFVNLLSTYEIQETLVPLFKKQLKYSYDLINSEKEEVKRFYTQKLNELLQRKEKLEERFAFGEIDKILYEKFSKKVDDEISNLESNIDNQEIQTSNLELYINTSISVSQNLSKYWQSGDIEVKMRTQNLVFPGGICLDTKNRQYLTKNTNPFFETINTFSTLYNNKKREQTSRNFSLSPVVARPRIIT